MTSGRRIPPKVCYFVRFCHNLALARVQKYMREGVAGEWRGSRATVLMEPRVQSRVIEGAAGEWKGRPWD